MPVIIQWQDSVGDFVEGLDFLYRAYKIYRDADSGCWLYIFPNEKVWVVTNPRNSFCAGVLFLDEITEPTAPAYRVECDELKNIYRILSTTDKNWSISVEYHTDRRLLEISATNRYTKVIETVMTRETPEDTEEVIKACSVVRSLIEDMNEYKYVGRFYTIQVADALKKYKLSPRAKIGLVGFTNDLYIVVIDDGKVVGVEVFSNWLEKYYSKPTFLFATYYKYANNLFGLEWTVFENGPLLVHSFSPIRRAIALAPYIDEKLIKLCEDAVKREEIIERSMIMDEIISEAKSLYNYESYTKESVFSAFSNVLLAISDLDPNMYYDELSRRYSWGRIEKRLREELRYFNVDKVKGHEGVFAGGFLRAYILDTIYDLLSEIYSKYPERFKVDVYKLRDKLDEQISKLMTAVDPIDYATKLEDLYFSLLESPSTAEYFIEKMLGVERREVKKVEKDYKEMAKKILEAYEKNAEKPLEEIFWIWMCAEALNEEIIQKIKELEEKYEKGEISADEYIEQYKNMKGAEDIKGRAIEGIITRLRPMTIDYWRSLIEKSMTRIPPEFRDIVEKHKDKLLERLPVEERPEAVPRYIREIEERFGREVAEAFAEARDDIIRRMKRVQKELRETPERLTVDEIYNRLVNEFHNAIAEELIRRMIPPVIATRVAEYVVERTEQRWRDIAEDIAAIRIAKPPKVPPEVTYEEIWKKKFPILRLKPDLIPIFEHFRERIVSWLEMLSENPDVAKDVGFVRIIERDALGRPIVAEFEDVFSKGKPWYEKPFYLDAELWAIAMATGEVPEGWLFRFTAFSPYTQLERYGETVKLRLARKKFLSHEELRKPLVPEPYRSKLLKALEESNVPYPPEWYV